MEETRSRELRITKRFEAPVKLLWEVWTNPEHIINWWGPDDFTSTIHVMDLKEGGEWRLTLHGPDGKNFPNRSIYKEIISLQKIVFEHFNPHFITTVIFKDHGEATVMDWILEFDTADMRETIVTAHKADEGQKQNVRKLNAYIEKLLS